MAAPNFWNDQNGARKTLDEANTLRHKIDSIGELERRISDGNVLVELGESEGEITREVTETEKRFTKFELEILLGEPHDKANAIFNIHAGAGGTESCDWANMMLRMYQRYCESRGFKVDLVDIQSGDEAGIKSVTMMVTG